MLQLRQVGGDLRSFRLCLVPFDRGPGGYIRIRVEVIFPKQISHRNRNQILYRKSKKKNPNLRIFDTFQSRVISPFYVVPGRHSLFAYPVSGFCATEQSEGCIPYVSTVCTYVVAFELRTTSNLFFRPVCHKNLLSFISIGSKR